MTEQQTNGRKKSERGAVREKRRGIGGGGADRQSWG